MDDIDASVDALIFSDGRDFGPLAAAYRTHGLRLPTIWLAPRTSEVWLPQQRDLLGWWLEEAASGLPAPSRIDPLGLRAHVGNLTVVAPTGDGDFVYRLHGSNIAMAAGYELTGRRVSQGPRQDAPPAPVLSYFLIVYRLVERRAAPLYAHHPWRRSDGSTFFWHRLVLPFGDDDIAKRLLVSNLRHGDDGRSPPSATGPGLSELDDP